MSARNSPFTFTPDGQRAVDCYVAEAPVDEATIWFQSSDGEALVASYNPRNDTLPGLVQPLSRGLISQVFLTGLPLLERDVSQRRGHDATIDSITGNPTRSLLAAPLSSQGDVVGVISAVRLVSTSHHRELSDGDLTVLDRLAHTLSSSLEANPDLDHARD